MKTLKTFEEINEDRPGKILHMLDTIDKSARSNKATDEQVATLLCPVRERLGLTSEPASPPTRAQSDQPTQWSIVKDIIDQMDEKQLPELIFYAALQLNNLQHEK